MGAREPSPPVGAHEVSMYSVFLASSCCFWPSPYPLEKLLASCETDSWKAGILLSRTDTVSYRHAARQPTTARTVGVGAQCSLGAQARSLPVRREQGAPCGSNDSRV